MAGEAVQLLSPNQTIQWNIEECSLESQLSNVSLILV